MTRKLIGLRIWEISEEKKGSDTFVVNRDCIVSRRPCNGGKQIEAKHCKSSKCGGQASQGWDRGKTGNITQLHPKGLFYYDSCYYQ